VRVGRLVYQNHSFKDLSIHRDRQREAILFYMISLHNNEQLRLAPFIGTKLVILSIIIHLISGSCDSISITQQKLNSYGHEKSVGILYSYCVKNNSAKT
jgi:hypothetical protein